MDANIIKMAKSMKRDYIWITPRYILGSDVNLGTLSIIYTNSDEEYLGTMAELDGRSKPDFAECMTPEILINKFRYLLNVVMILTDTPPIIYEKDITSFESFVNTSRNIKAGDGAKMFKYEEYVMSNFSSLHPLNKSDTIHLSIYSAGEHSFISEFIIQKKNYQIREYIRYLNI